MKINLPVTNVEHPFPKGEAIVSKTDLKGMITHANDAFVETSGFSRKELVGENHNVVRHPEMPPEAFADLWATIAAGNPWRGIVRNRRKNGDHYWVKALVVPVRKHDQTVGYMSVRTEATAEEKAEAGDLYRNVMAKRARLKRVRLADFLPASSFNVRYGLFVATMSLLSVGSGVAGLAGASGLAVLACAASFALAITSAVFMALTVNRPLEQAVGYFDQMAQGNLDNEIPVDRPDEVGRVLAGLATAQAHMRVMIDEIRISAKAVDRRCEQLENEVRRATGLSGDQADRVRQVSAAMDEVSASVTEVAQTAAGAADSAKKTLEVVNEGNQRMTRSMEATDQVAAAVQASGQQIDRLSQSIDRIGTVTRVIKDIADQTNLLALNAAIEAARAGEQGRGFAVVADEVRKLAERTANSTGDISRMVAEIQATTRSAVAAMENAVQRVSQGRGLIEETHESLQRITALSESVTGMSDCIAHAAREQSLATEEVARNAEQMSQLIEENGASVAQVSDAVGELRRTAGQLREAIEHFGTHARE